MSDQPEVTTQSALVALRGGNHYCGQHKRFEVMPQISVHITPETWDRIAALDPKWNPERLAAENERLRAAIYHFLSEDRRAPRRTRAILFLAADNTSEALCDPYDEDKPERAKCKVCGKDSWAACHFDPLNVVGGHPYVILTDAQVQISEAINALPRALLKEPDHATD